MTSSVTMRQNGYTLIELLLYISVIGVLLGAVTTFLSMAIESRVKAASIIEVEQQGILAMDYMTQTIRNAASITAPAAGASASSLTLVVPTGSLSPTIFDLDGVSSALRVKEGVGAVIPLTNSKVQVTQLSFKNLTRPSTPGAVQITMTLSRINTMNRNEYDYQKTFTATAALRQ